jgi:S1-C subfamily serine protease
VFSNRLESLEAYPGSEFWQEFIAQYEERIVATAAVTGAAIVSAPTTGNPPWVQGSAWLIASDRVVTNRHVLVSPRDDLNLVENARDGAVQFRADHAVSIEFAADDRAPRAKVQRRATRVLYLAKLEDPVDIAVLAIEPLHEHTPLSLAPSAGIAPNNLFVVGHPALMAQVPDAVQAVFGKPDGHKRVSFGKRLEGAARRGEIAYDASTVGGFSGGPVLGISDGVVAGLHYYGDPASGNLAITAAAIRAHRAYAALIGAVP